jgi:hypothetical protein
MYDEFLQQVKLLVASNSFVMSPEVKFSCYRPKQAFGDPAGYGFRIFSTFGTTKVVRFSPLRTGRLYLQEFFWYSFLEAESSPGHIVPSIASEKNPQRHDWGSIPRPSD